MSATKEEAMTGSEAGQPVHGFRCASYCPGKEGMQNRSCDFMSGGTRNATEL
ncbi:hypothetical protein Vi05172_g6852 [Venturia inaequalis]|nr:hypothetical protein Vi05172_g6852 [Venturia inaequalis]